MEENTPQIPPLVTIEEFAKIQLRVATIIEAEAHPKADRLIVMKVDLGDSTRQIVAGIRKFYEPASLIGKSVVVVANLQPAMLRGVESQGMLLAASSPEDVAILTPERPLPPGTVVK